MSFSYLKKKFRKKQDETKPSLDENVEIIPVDPPGEEAGESKQESTEAPEKKQEEEEILNNLMNRMNEIENDIPRIKVSIDTLKTQISDLRKEIERLDGTIKDVMVLYEVVSQEINPFKDSSKENPLLTEIQLLSQKLDRIKAEVSKIKSDIRLLAVDGIDLDDLIDEVTAGGRR